MGKFRALNDAKRAERAARQDDSNASRLVVCVGFHGSGTTLCLLCPPLADCRRLDQTDHHAIRRQVGAGCKATGSGLHARQERGRRPASSGDGARGSASAGERRSGSRGRVLLELRIVARVAMSTCISSCNQGHEDPTLSLCHCSRFTGIPSQRGHICLAMIDVLSWHQDPSEQTGPGAVGPRRGRPPAARTGRAGRGALGQPSGAFVFGIA